MTGTIKGWFKPLARAGYAARGLVYAVIGFFAALAAVGAGRPMDSKQALDELLSSGFGSFVQLILVASLTFYALWRLIQAGFDTDRHGSSLKGLVIRAGLAVGGFVYLTLAAYALSLGSAGSDSGEGGGFAEMLAGVVGSRWASLLIALVLAGVAIAHAVKALKGSYAKYLQAGGSAMRVIDPVAKTGLIARGLVFLTLAFLSALRAWRADGGADTPGTREALQYVQSLPAGGMLLAAMGLGLIAFALYSFIEAWFRRIDIENA